LSAASSAAYQVADSCRLTHRPPVSKNPIVGWLAGLFCFNAVFDEPVGIGTEPVN